METGTSLATLTALFGAMVVLAAVPSVSVLTVSARSAAFGFRHGVATTLGVVTGDLVFIVLALSGLALLVEALGNLFFVVEYLAAAYLMGLGLLLLRSRGGPPQARRSAASLPGSFLVGLVVTLGDQKAVLFYLGFLPAFVDVATVTLADTWPIGLVAVLAVGGVKLAYAWVAARTGSLLGAGAGRALEVTAAGILMAVGVIMALNI